MTPAGAFSADELRAYRDQGYLVRESVFTGPEVEGLRSAVDRAVEAARRLAATGRQYFLDGKRFVDVGHVTIQFEPDRETVKVIEPVHELEPDLDRLLDDTRITAPMQSILGTGRLALWTDKLNTKSARSGSGFGWHQDSPYWIHDSGHVDLMPNVMLALDRATAANGALACIAGSHRRGRLPGTADGSQLGGFYTDPQCFSEADKRLFEVPAGSLIFFDPNIVHGSGPNESDRPRRALVLTYQPADFPALKSKRIRNIP